MIVTQFKQRNRNTQRLERIETLIITRSRCQTINMLQTILNILWTQKKIFHFNMMAIKISVANGKFSKEETNQAIVLISVCLTCRIISNHEISIDLTLFFVDVLDGPWYFQGTLLLWFSTNPFETFSPPNENHAGNIITVKILDALSTFFHCFHKKYYSWEEPTRSNPSVPFMRA